jgi:DNA-binding NtrC family response regulator
LDLVMPGIDGMEVLRRIRQINTNLPVVILTATQLIRTAVEAMKLGASDYLTKPFDLDELRLVIDKCLLTRELQKEVHSLRWEVKKRFDFGNVLIGQSTAMQAIYSKIEQIADTRTTVLIVGESGTGKELVAKALHYNSGRRDRPIVAINCAAIPEGLIESELFGHEKGAFTNALSRKPGQFELAHTGTLFLDEVSELSLQTQSKILRAIQEREFVRVGGTRPIRVDVRLITATNKNLEEGVRNGSFREDLYYRINVVPIHLPPLRDRREDVPMLVKYFIGKTIEADGGPSKTFTDQAMDLLIRHDWPGNVRELENVVEQAMTLARGNEIGAEDLPPRLHDQSRPTNLREEAVAGRLSLDRAVSEFEREILLAALKKTGYVQTHAAALLGISRRILKYKMDCLGIIARQEEAGGRNDS